MCTKVEKLSIPSDSVDNIDKFLDEQKRNNHRAYNAVSITTPKLNVIVQKEKTHADLAKFLHGA